MKPEKRQMLIEALLKDIAKLHKKVKRLTEACNHPKLEGWNNSIWSGGTTVACQICGKNLVAFTGGCETLEDEKEVAQQRVKHPIEWRN
jgi:hypothetical protein